MSASPRRLTVIIGSLLLTAIFASGCTLAGASPAPLTPVAPGGLEPSDLDEPPFEDTVPTPTEIAPIDVFGTQTAMAPSPEEITPEEPETTPEPGEEIPPAEATEEAAQPAPAEPAAAATQEAQPQPAGACPPTHTVQSGENLYRIALRYGLTYQQLASANGIADPNRISVGTVLNIPGCGGQPGAGTGAAPTQGETQHTVQAGENLFRIALRYGLTYQQVASYNGIANPNMIVVGQVIRIPPR
jgi:LysM repeat protein